MRLPDPGRERRWDSGSHLRHNAHLNLTQKFGPHDSDLDLLAMDVRARLDTVAKCLDAAVTDPMWLELDVLMALADVVRRAHRDLELVTTC